jgi:hypothetical protein
MSEPSIENKGESRQSSDTVSELRRYARVVILHSCDYPAEAAAAVLRRNVIRIAELAGSRTAR